MPLAVSAAFDAQEDSGLAGTFTDDMATRDPIRRFVIVGDELLGLKVGHIGHQVLGALKSKLPGQYDKGPPGLGKIATTPEELLAQATQEPQAVRIKLADVERCELRGESFLLGPGFFRVRVAGAKPRKFAFTTTAMSGVGCTVLREALADRVVKAGFF